MCGEVRTSVLTPEECKELARQAAAKRWEGHKAKRAKVVAMPKKESA